MSNLVDGFGEFGKFPRHQRRRHGLLQGYAECISTSAQQAIPEILVRLVTEHAQQRTIHTFCLVPPFTDFSNDPDITSLKLDSRA